MPERPELSDDEVGVLRYLYVESQNGRSPVGLEISRELGIELRACERAVERLRALGLVRYTTN